MKGIAHGACRGREEVKNSCFLYSVIVDYITMTLRNVIARNGNTRERTFPSRTAKKLKEKKYEIPWFYAIRCYDVALHRCFRAVRRAQRLRGSCAVRGAEVLHNHEEPGGRVGRSRHRARDAGDVKRQAAPRLDARNVARAHARARIPGSRHAVGSRPSTIIRSRCFTSTETSSP